MINHQRFEKEFGGQVFFVYSTKGSTGKKKIYNIEVIDQIKDEYLGSLKIYSVM